MTMAPNATMKLSGANSSLILTAYVAAFVIATCLGDTLELVFLTVLAFVAEHFLSKKKVHVECIQLFKFKGLLQMSADTKQKLLALLMCIFAGIAIYFNCAQLAISLMTGLGYFAAHQLGKMGKNRILTPCQRSMMQSDARPSPSLGNRSRPTFTSSRDHAFKQSGKKSSNATAKPKADNIADAGCQSIGAQTSRSVRVKSKPITGQRVSTSQEILSAPLPSVDEQIEQLIFQHTSTSADEEVVNQIANMVHASVSEVVPEAEVMGFATSNLLALANSGVKPEVEIVCIVDAGVLRARLEEYYMKGQSKIPKRGDGLAPEVLSKTASRVLSERFESVKFWRSQFSGPDPKIVLLVPAELGFFAHPIRMNFSVNNRTIVSFSNLFTKSDLRTARLITLVTQWTKNRAIANAAKGNLHEYGWAKLVAHFLSGSDSQSTVEERTVQLFADFVGFCLERIRRRDAVGGVEVCSHAEHNESHHASPPVSFLEDAIGGEAGVPRTLTAEGLARMKAELVRAIAVLARPQREAALPKLLEKWVPLAA